jgi:filamentous hemagglutinin family protein
MKMRIVSLWLASFVFTLGIRVCPANPTGGSVVGGDGNATINGSGTPITIINQHGNRVIINWQNFSIGSGEITRFIQPSASSWALNRVISGNPSLIYGSLQANGHVIVVNPNGIVVSAAGRVDTKGFIASTLDLRDSSFMKGGALSLSGNSTASVRNEGTIQALGGDVFLIGNTVENSGTINAPQGTVGLAAGSSVRLVQAGNERISVLAGNANGAAANGVNNLGTVQGASAELKAAGGNIYALAINNQGAVRANSIVSEGGHVYLRASGGNIQNSGTISANKADGSGGTVIVDGGHNAGNASTVVNSGTIEARGDASGTKGGKVEILGDDVRLVDHALVDVSGNSGGGAALIGGDLQGQNPAVRNSQFTTVESGAEIHADATGGGNAGKVVVWSDDTTHFDGAIYARALGGTGKGGVAEISGHEHLAVGADGHAYLAGAKGEKGQLLMDPGSVDINHENSGNTGPNGNLDTFFDDWIVNQLNAGGADLTISTANSLNGAAENLTVNSGANISWNSANSLSLIGRGSLTIQSGTTIANAGSGGLSLQSSQSGASVGGISLSGAINMAGNVNISASGNLTLNSDITAAALDARSGTDGVGNLAFAGGAGGITINANSQSYRAGNGTGTGAGGAIVDFHPTGTDPSFRATSGGTAPPTDFTYRQDHSIAAADLPLAGRFGSALPSAYTIQSDGGSVNLPGMTLPGSLQVIAGGGDITENGALLVAAGSATFTTTGAHDVTLDKANNFSTVSVTSGGNATINDANAVDLGASSVTGNLTVSAGNGGITDSGAVSVTGNADFTASANKTIVLDSGFSVAGTLGLHTSGASGNATVVSGSGINIADSSVGGTLSVTAGGDITESGTLTVSAGPSTFTINGVTANVILDQANNFGNQTVTIAATGGGAVQDVSFRNISPLATTIPVLPGGLRNLTLEFNGAGVNLPALTLTGDLNVIAGGGDIIGASAVTVGGNADFRTTRNNDDINLSVLSVTGTLGLHTIHTSGLTGGDATVVSGGALNFAASTIGHNVTVTAGGNITESGAITTGGTASFTATTAGSDVLLASQANDFNGISVSGPIHNLAIRNVNAGAAVPVLPLNLNDLTLIFNNAGITLPGVTLSGNLIVSAGGDITQSGAIVQANPGQTATFGFSGTPHNIVLNNVGNDFNTVSVSSGNDVTLVDANRINLGASSISGNLNVSALNGPITQSGSLLVNVAGKTATFSAAGAGNDIFLTDSGNDFSTILLSGNNVNVHDVNGLTLGASTVSGNLFITAAGAIGQSGALNVAGLASFLSTGSGANGNITLNDGGNNFGSLGLNSANGNAVSVTEGSDTALDTVSVNNGNLTINSAGVISQVSGTTIKVSGLADFTSTGSGANGEILMANAGNNFGSLGLHSANGDGVLVFEASSTALDTVSVPNGVVIIVSGGDITQVGGKTILTGPGSSFFEAPAGNSILINNPGNTFNGTVGFASSTPGNLLNVAVSDTTAFDLQALTLDGNLTVNAGGPITQSGTLNVGGLASFTATGSGANGNITLTDGANNFGSIGLNSANGSVVQVAEGSGTALDDVAVNGDLFVTSGGDITQIGGKTVAVGGAATFTSIPGASVLLGNAGNAFSGPVNFVSSGIGNLLNVTVQNNGAFNIQGLTIDGNLDVTANGAITEGGALRIGGTTRLAAGSGNDITLTGANDFGGAVDIVSARNVSLNDINALTVGGTLVGDLSTVAGGPTTFNTLSVGGLLTVVANGLISDNGNVTVGGATTLNAGFGNDIVLDNANDFGAAVSIVAANNVTLVDVNNLTVGGNVAGSLTTTTANGATAFNALNVGANLTATANGTITDNGVLNVGGTTTLAAGSGNDITLDNADDFGGAVSIVSGRNVTLNDVNSLALGNSSISGNLNITANGAIFDSGNVTVVGSTTLAAGIGNNISFTHADDFGGPVSIVSGNNVTLTDVNAIDLGASTVSGGLTVVAGGDITDSGNLTVANGASFSTAGGSSIILDESGNTFNGPVTFASTGGGSLHNVTVVDTTAFDITGVTVSGTFSVNSGGPVTQSGAVVAGNLDVTSAGSVTLNDNANHVTALTVDANGTVQFRDDAGTKLTINGIDSHNNDITVSADDMEIAGAVTSGTADTLLQPVTPGRDLHFGSPDSPTALNFTQGELENITAHTLTIGNSTAGNIVGAGAVSKPVHVVNFQIVNGSSIVNVQSLFGQLASFLAGTALPTPRLEVATYSGGAIDLEKAAKMLPPGSIGTLFLQVPFVPVEEKKFKVEEISKWTTGRIAASGTTAGPQTPR